MVHIQGLKRCALMSLRKQKRKAERILLKCSTGKRGLPTVERERVRLHLQTCELKNLSELSSNTFYQLGTPDGSALTFLKAEIFWY